jgi:hypothetical protein
VCSTTGPSCPTPTSQPSGCLSPRRLPRIGTWLNVNETVRDVLRNVVQHIVDENDETVNCEENDLLYDSQWWGACREVFCGLY